MRLMNVGTELLEIFVSDVPDYAILSHTWRDEEISFEDMQQQAGLELKKGFAKLRNCCAYARREGFKYIWIDTCCIDKRDPTELSEAINSMFRWYSNAAICYVYLDDYDATGQTPLENCRWFYRGWTLQELLAPYSVVFLDSSWTKFGDKSSLRERISDITGIPKRNLFDLFDRYNVEVNVGTKISWAARRKTTRVEDEAYCLLGLLGIHMPLLYGEGKNAFIRLQEEIVRISNDESIFVHSQSIKQLDIVRSL
ncbi:HET-domain-containing protein [Pseudovirgaria hyperparasitica]|uniref:HET-domain-containing protein n=1 Tax=Pseudovirgaria hyperparasitica TaxID=470096 RepID=A0A6A6WJY8_9PEZI|nr:HET-domain-containing protein [Pseudovirgaria hyperparasitica]KAF2761941.1 HET-domain-containing protein [Pseudovirgaria hyperparasitica]